VTTDGEGCFVLALPVGKHKLTLETEGYEPATVDNVLSTGWGPDRDVVVRLGPQG
jgi:hypothetical protein